MIRFTSGSLFKVISLCKSGRRYSDEKIAEMLFPNVEYTTNYMLLKGDGEQVEHIVYGSTLSADGNATRQFDFMLANPPYGKSWKVDAEKMGGKKEILDTRFNTYLEDGTEMKMIPRTSDKMLVQYKKDIADYKSKLKEAQSRPYYNPRHNKPENEPAFFKEMSDECMSRAIAILDTVFKSIESLGGSINSDLSVKIRDDIVRFRMVESQDQVKHEMTKQEAQELVKYNDDIKNHRWASKPQIRKYDKVYNGKLRIEFGERSYIRDNDSEKLEDRLGDILVTLYEKAEENRIVREAREESERKRVEEARCREENRQRKEQEIRLVKELVNKAEDYRIAKEIREYIQAMIDSGNEDITPEWIEWALKKADWYDPSIETEDEYLGKRQHEKSAEEKEKSLQDSIRKSWYW